MSSTSLAQEPSYPKESLASRMKSYEALYSTTISPTTPTIIRLDGHGFSKFTSNFARPFDTRIHNAMVAVCSDLLDHYPSVTVAYTQSDEITLIFPNGIGEMFGGRVQKLVSLAASFCSVRFDFHLRAEIKKGFGIKKEVDEGRVLGKAYFDARVFTTPDVEECLNNLLWRCKGDAIRNSVQGFAWTLFSHKELHGKNTKEMLTLMEEKGVVFAEAVPTWARERSLVKRETSEFRGVNGKTGLVEVTMRTRIRVVDRGITKFDEEGLSVVREKYWVSMVR